jgi:hypothetical protein
MDSAVQNNEKTLSRIIRQNKKELHPADCCD